jgi:hypothetical protein
MTQRKSTPKNQFGLLAGMDKDIESAKHDDIMLWTDKNLDIILPKLFPDYFGDYWVTLNSENLEEDWRQHTSQAVRFVYPRKVPYTVKFPHVPYILEEKVWERPLRDPQGGLVGFTDLYVRATYFGVQGWMEWNKDNYGADPHKMEVYFEIKTTIQLGQLLRQINLYKSRTNFMNYAPEYVVVSPDTRYKDILKEQGVWFVEYLDQL